MFINLEEIEKLLQTYSLYKIHKECGLNRSALNSYKNGQIPLNSVKYETLEKLQKYINKLKKEGSWNG